MPPQCNRCHSWEWCGANTTLIIMDCALCWPFLSEHHRYEGNLTFSAEQQELVCPWPWETPELPWASCVYLPAMSINTASISIAFLHVYLRTSKHIFNKFVASHLAITCRTKTACLLHRNNYSGSQEVISKRPHPEQSRQHHLLLATVAYIQRVTS